MIRCMAGLLAAAALQPSHAQEIQRRDWWCKGPGGSYGLMEVRMTTPAAATSRTTVLLGPWRRTFEATAPQLIVLVAVPSLVAAFTWGWIKTRRR